MDRFYRLDGVSQHVCDVAKSVSQDLTDCFLKIDAIREDNQLRVLHAFRASRISEAHFGFATGYGYDDIGRERIERIFADVFGGEAALVRIQISSGTQAIALCLFAILRPGDELVSATGQPYDSLLPTIGTSHTDNIGALSDFGISFRQVDMIDDNAIDFDALAAAIGPKTKMVMIQRSCGYAQRRSLLTSDIKAICDFVHKIDKSMVVFVDNCYGEFVSQKEPCHLGADLCAGSLIKNPGGGLCMSGGYVVGNEALIKKVASRLTAPGLGRFVGPSLGFSRQIAQGLYLAPHITAECLKGAVFSAALFERFGYKTKPAYDDERGDIVQSITFDAPKRLIQFCQTVQACSPIDAHVAPEPWQMPGYASEVIMAAGTFVQGASIELSADGPMTPPYTAYMQGGLVFEQTKLAAMMAVEKMEKNHGT